MNAAGKLGQKWYEENGRLVPPSPTSGLCDEDYRDSWVNGAMDNGSNCLLVQNVAGTERIGLSHSKVAWLMVQEILDNGSISFLFSKSKLHIFSH